MKKIKLSFVTFLANQSSPIQGYDANQKKSFISVCYYERHADRTTHHQKKENNYKAEQTDLYGKQAREWLEYTAHIKKHSHSAQVQRERKTAGI